MNEKKLLDIKNLTIHYITKEGTVHAVEDLDISIGSGETLGLVGETGAGKTTMALGVMGLVPDPPGVIKNGEILYNNEDLLKKSTKEMRSILGKDIAMIFQDPMTSLNPVMRVKDQIAEMILLHRNIGKKEAEEEALKMLEVVGIKRERGHEFPHQFSGGMKQRVVIAIALACEPKLIIADEPTTALDVTIQAQILDLMNDLKEEFRTSMILITHDLGVVAETCDKVAIMYSGKLVEYGDKETIFTNPRHPYTLGLLGSIPDVDVDQEWIEEIDGLAPDPTEVLQGCSFNPRCPKVHDKCYKNKPKPTYFGEENYVRCFLYESSSSKAKGKEVENNE